ncbi:hypothetical protein Drorol1_Dr00024938 [Drosera rotundifolia]
MLRDFNGLSGSRQRPKGDRGYSSWNKISNLEITLFFPVKQTQTQNLETKPTKKKTPHFQKKIEMSATNNSMPISVSLFAMVWLLLAAAVAAQSGSDVATCGQSLVPCESYLNATKPPSSCCDPLKEALDTEKTCLCSILNSPNLLSSFGINVTEALTLPVRCGIAANATNICASVPAASPANTSPPPPPPPGSVAGRITGSTVFGLITLWMAVLMLHYVSFVSTVQEKYFTE